MSLLHNPKLHLFISAVLLMTAVSVIAALVRAPRAQLIGEGVTVARPDIVSGVCCIDVGLPPHLCVDSDSSTPCTDGGVFIPGEKCQVTAEDRDPCR